MVNRKRERVLFVVCPLCDSKAFTDSVVGDCSNHDCHHESLSPAIKWKWCAKCNHIFTEGYYTDEALKLIFSKSNDNQKVGFHIEQERGVSSRIIEKVLQYKDSGYWLDVGFGNGSLMFTAKEYGFETAGLDLREENVKLMTALEYEVHQKDITDMPTDKTYSVISMADVLEHTPYPKKTLQSAHKLLDKSGVLFVSMPNTDSIVWKVLDQQKQNPYWGELEHYHNFSRERLYGLLNETGFTPVKYGVSERYRSCMEVIAIK